MKRIIHILLAGCFLMVAVGCQSRGPLKVLVVTGTHGYQKAEFNAMVADLEGMECTVKEMGKDPGPAFEDVEGFEYDAIAMYNFNQTLSAADRKNFEALLDKGVGLTVMHHAIAGFPEWVEYENIIGATYVLKEQSRDGKHFPLPTWKHGVDMDIMVVDKNHPITKGVEDFMIHDETYKGWVFHEGNHLLLRTDNPLNNSQIAWTRPHPKTRVFYIQLGHGKFAYQNENFQKLVRQGIMWTAGR